MPSHSSGPKLLPYLRGTERAKTTTRQRASRKNRHLTPAIARSLPRNRRAQPDTMSRIDQRGLKVSSSHVSLWGLWENPCLTSLKTSKRRISPRLSKKSFVSVDWRAGNWARAWRQKWSSPRSEPDESLYFHSDGGSQYSSEAVRKPLSVIGANQSMSGVGNCYDNATMEAFFSTLKTECFPDIKSSPAGPKPG